jgi:hypothetical protein
MERIKKWGNSTLLSWSFPKISHRFAVTGESKEDIIFKK